MNGISKMTTVFMVRPEHVFPPHFDDDDVDNIQHAVCQGSFAYFLGVTFANILFQRHADDVVSNSISHLNNSRSRKSVFDSSEERRLAALMIGFFSLFSDTLFWHLY